MTSRNDLDLLREFTRDHSQDAFTALVQRHLSLVYCAGLRQVRSPQLAEEVAQSVFTDLARNAARLKPDTILTAWLYEVTRRTAINVVRGEARRQFREQIGLEMNGMNAHANDWTQIEPLLDEAMHALDGTDRAAVLLRYFENKSLREVGESLGTTDDTARKRVNRAIEHLREFFAKRGVTVGASGLVVVISANAVQAAPVGLFLTIATATALGGTTIVAAATATALKTIVMTVTQKVLVTTILTTSIGTGIYQARQASHARDLINTLQQEQAALSEQNQQLIRERDEATRRLAVPDDGGLNRAIAGLLKLQGEVAGLRGAALPNSGDPTQTAAQAWLSRVNQLKQYLEQHPEGKIPELQFVTEDEWLRTTMSAFGTNNSGVTDQAYRQALVSLRNIGKSKFSALARGALKSYALTHDHQFPKEILELKVHFTDPVDDAILQRYAVLPSATFKNLRSGMGDWVMAEITSPDEDLDYRYVTYADGNDTLRFKQSMSEEVKAQMEAQMQPLVETLMPVATAYAAAHEGRPPPDAKEMIAYATTPEQQSALQKLIEIKNEGVSGVSPTRYLITPPANNGK